MAWQMQLVPRIMNKKRVTTSAICLLLNAGVVFAQNAVVPAGDNAIGTGGTVSYTVGQVGYEFHSGTDGSVASGVQQAYEIYITSSSELSGIDLALSVFPNPTADVLTLTIEQYAGQRMVYELYDLQGQRIATESIGNNSTSINMQHLPSSTYYLRVSAEKALVKTFKIVKN